MIFLVRHPMVFTFLNIFDLLEYLVMLMTLVLVIRLRFLRQGYRYHKIRKSFSQFYWRHFDIVCKYNVGLKTLLLQGELVYKFRKIIGKNDFP